MVKINNHGEDRIGPRLRAHGWSGVLPQVLFVVSCLASWSSSTRFRSLWLKLPSRLKILVENGTSVPSTHLDQVPARSVGWPLVYFFLFDLSSDLFNFKRSCHQYRSHFGSSLAQLVFLRAAARCEMNGIHLHVYGLP